MQFKHSATVLQDPRSASLWKHQCSFERCLTSSRPPLRAHRQATSGAAAAPDVTMMVIDRRSGHRDAQRRRRHERIRHAGQKSSHRCQCNTPCGSVCRHDCRQLVQRAAEYTQTKSFPHTHTPSKNTNSLENRKSFIFATREFHRFPVRHSSSNTT